MFLFNQQCSRLPDTAYLQCVGDGVRQQVAKEDWRPQVQHEGHIKVLPNVSGVFECHCIFYRHDVDHQHTTLISTATAGLLEVCLGLLVADVLVTEALWAFKLLTLIVSVILCYRLKAQLGPEGGSREEMWWSEVRAMFVTKEKGDC